MDLGSLFESVGAGEVFSRVQRAFRLMGVAEEEIAEAKARYRRSTKRVHACFGALAPTPLLLALGERVYRDHCRELLSRAVRHADLRPPTRAEVVAAISRLTLVCRLQNDVELLGLRLSAEIFPEKAGELLPRREEDYAGSVEEVHAEFRRWLLVRWRTEECLRAPRERAA